MQLSTPGDLAFEAGTLSYTGDTNAIEYEIADKDGEVYTQVGTSNSETWESDLPAGTYNLAVRAIGDGEDFITSDWSETIEVIIAPDPVQLDAPTFSIITGDRLSISGDNAVEYEVGYNDGSEFITLATFDSDGSATVDNIYGADIPVPTNEEYDLFARSIGDGVNFLTSDWTETPVTIDYSLTPLAKPTDVSYDSPTLEWTGDANAERYAIFRDGVDTYSTQSGSGATSFALGSFLTTPGTYRIAVRAIGDGTTYRDSLLSDEIEVVIPE